MRNLDELITDSPIFAGMQPSHLETIAGCGHNQHVAPDTLLLREGDPADIFYMIRRGTVALEVHVPGRGPVVIETLNPGEAVGWSWLFEPYRWHLDGRAVEDSSLVTFDAACLRSKVDGDHELGYELMKRFAANLVDRIQASRLQMLDVYGRAPV